MAIRVLVISDYRDYHTVRPEANIFVGLAKMGFEVYVMTYPNASYLPHFKEAGITVIEFHPQNKFDKAESKRIRDFIIEKDIQILHLFNSKAIISGIRAAKGLGVKVLLYRGFTGNIRWYDPSAYLKFLHPRVDKIVCNSIGVENYIQSQWGVKKDKTVTINKGHELSWYQYEPLDIRKELSLNHDAFLLVNVANNRRMKGIPYLLQAMTMLRKEADIHLLLIGRDMDTPSNRKILAKGAVEHRVHFLGFRKDVLNIVAACNVFASSSLFGESITKSIIEAMALGVTPIITDIPGNVELVEQGKGGLIVPKANAQAMADAILQLYDNQAFCKEMGLVAQQRISNELHTSKTIAAYAKLYSSLVSS